MIQMKDYPTLAAQDDVGGSHRPLCCSSHRDRRCAVDLDRRQYHQLSSADLDPSRHRGDSARICSTRS